MGGWRVDIGGGIYVFRIFSSQELLCMLISMPACLENDLTGHGTSYPSSACCIIIHCHNVLARKTTSSPLAHVKLTKHFFQKSTPSAPPSPWPEGPTAHDLHKNASHYMHTTFKACCCCLRSKDSWTPRPQIHPHRQPPFDRHTHPQPLNNPNTYYVYTPQPLLPFCLSPQQANKATL
jgi:hypothetical protein